MSHREPMKQSLAGHPRRLPGMRQRNVIRRACERALAARGIRSVTLRDQIGADCRHGIYLRENSTP